MWVLWVLCVCVCVWRWLTLLTNMLPRSLCSEGSRRMTGCSLSLRTYRKPVIPPTQEPSHNSSPLQHIGPCLSTNSTHCISLVKLSFSCNPTHTLSCGISETWLSDEITNDQIYIESFQPPISKDRFDEHGGLAIYVKENLTCKPRYDLNIPDLEAIWIETKLGQETVLIGSFSRPPNSPVD